MLRSSFKEILSGWVKATNQPFTDHPIANKLREDLKTQIRGLLPNEASKYIIKASAGAGNWANIPWLSILDPKKAKSTQEGIYPVFLFRADGSGFYLSLGFGATKLKDLHGTAGAKKEAINVATKIHKITPEIVDWGNSKIDLRATTELGKSYEWASAGAKFYAIDSIPTDQQLKTDLLNLIKIYQKLPNNGNPIQSSSITRTPKPFILLAGISGTGKTRFVKKQAEELGNGKNNYCLVPVRPDWHEPSDLLGYISRFGQSGKPEYVSTKTLNFIIKAWKAIAPHANENGHGDLDFTVPPYWLCLDEMNLAPVEQYFADYLSVLETRKFEDGKYTSEALLDKSQLLDLQQQGADVQKDLGLTDDDELWQYFLDHGISIPPNLIVAGTVNMDETTHGFSRKVIDRALTIDFGEFYPNDYEHFFESPIEPKTFTYSLLTQATKDDLLATYDIDGSKTINFLTEVNNVLKRTPFELAYRALNELLLQVACFNPSNEKELQAVWDDFLMSKILPRIDGDEDKLRLIIDDNETNVLEELTSRLEKQLALIWGIKRLDFYQKNKDGSKLEVECRTKKKLRWMIERLETNTFTSFWP